MHLHDHQMSPCPTSGKVLYRWPFHHIYNTLMQRLWQVWGNYICIVLERLGDMRSIDQVIWRGSGLAPFPLVTACNPVPADTSGRKTDWAARSPARWTQAASAEPEGLRLGAEYYQPKPTRANPPSQPTNQASTEDSIHKTPPTSPHQTTTTTTTRIATT